MKSSETLENAKDRLLRAAAQLLEEAEGKNVSTRAICDLAGVTAPTLYHHFGSKQGLFDAVVEYGLGQYSTTREPGSGDPVEDLRRGWDEHVRYGLDHPSFYVLLYGQIAPGRPCAVTGVAEERLLHLLNEIAGQGRLEISPADAVRQIVAANVGVTLRLIAMPVDQIDMGLSADLRDRVIDSMVSPGPKLEGGPSSQVSEAAKGLLGSLDANSTTSGLAPSELPLLRAWLTKMSEP